MSSLLNKRDIARDHRAANIGMSRRIILRTRPTPPTPAYNPDPTVDTTQNYNPNDDVLMNVVGTFSYSKTQQVDGILGGYDVNSGIVRFHMMYLSYVQDCYAMEIGQTNKTWKKSSPPILDGLRTCVTIKVEAMD